MRIELYGVLRELAGQAQIELADAPSTVADALSILAAEQPQLAPHLERSACAIGDALVTRETALETNTTLVLLPPISGG